MVTRSQVAAMMAGAQRGDVASAAALLDVCAECDAPDPLLFLAQIFHRMALAAPGQSPYYRLHWSALNGCYQHWLQRFTV